MNLEPDDLRSVARHGRTITTMLWRSRNEATTGRSSWGAYRQSRWWDWVDGLCEPVGKTDTQTEPQRPEPETITPH